MLPLVNLLRLAMVWFGKKGASASMGALAENVRVAMARVSILGTGSQSSTSHQAGDPGLSPTPATGAVARPVSVSLTSQLATGPFIKPGAESEASQACAWGGPGWAPERDSPLEPIPPPRSTAPPRLLQQMSLQSIKGGTNGIP